MAFMMPVMRNDYNIYASRSRTNSSSSIPDQQPTSARMGRRATCESAPVSLSCSPGSDLGDRLAAVSLGCSPRRNSTLPVLHDLAEVTSPPRSGSQTSLTKFHSRVVEKLRRKFRPKDESEPKTPELGSSPAS